MESTLFNHHYAGAAVDNRTFVEKLVLTDPTRVSAFMENPHSDPDAVRVVRMFWEQPGPAPGAENSPLPDPNQENQ